MGKGLTLGGYAKVAVIGSKSAVVGGLRTDSFIDAVTDGRASSTESMAVVAVIFPANPNEDMFFGVKYDIGAGAKAAIKATGSNIAVIISA